MQNNQYTKEIHSPIGSMTISSDGTNITGLWMQGQKYYGATLGNHEPAPSLPVFKLAEEWLERYFNGDQPKLTLPLAPQGNVFRNTVWDILCEIPYGEVITYGEIAKMMAKRLDKATMSAQAVGGAVGHNPISIIVPCHRVVGAKGSLTGYAGGIDRKIKLLQLEKVNMDKLYIPAKGTAL
ncbi:methylated-DNA--[protein]-cysteine S-methyltransferase [Paenibacillus pasadenensis]|uniref:methylated-DNA--[protein]-cysteine S-methyltransferase n=1 Tax=Paenibacillus pasadenensis TaxID=217090 RepID=UPI00204261A5|nr:methylated-DNA--[protein]-cysteine S-methyltransferase [Paenibacillus pasadenensis]MCM3747188.1 methylated-DNA--[protein]-cysteine S-methyltransferase [Paenibacillus pasadenensis]